MLTLSTPAIVFPALSVLMLAYTNKFIAISKRTRALHAEHVNNPKKNLIDQINLLLRRMKYIRNMQISALLGFSINILSILLIFLELNGVATIFFIVGLLFVFISLVICIIEIYISSGIMSILLEEDSHEFQITSKK